MLGYYYDVPGKLGFRSCVFKSLISQCAETFCEPLSGVLVTEDHIEVNIPRSSEIIALCR